MEIKVINEDKKLVLRLPANQVEPPAPVPISKVPPLNLPFSIEFHSKSKKPLTQVNQTQYESVESIRQNERVTMQDLEKDSDYQPDQVQTARSVVFTARDNDNYKRDSLNQSISSVSYAKQNYQSQSLISHRLSFNRNSSTADMSRATRNLKSQALEISCASSQSHETNAIFSLDHVLPSSNVETNRFTSSEFVEQNMISKEYLLKDMKSLKQNREKYEDSIFIGDEYALVNNITNTQNQIWLEDFQWKRMKDLYPRYKFQLFSSLSCQTLIKPGVVEIPYLVSALNILKDYPNRIMNIVENQTLNDTCLYYARLCIDGVWKYIQLDDFFPCIRKTKATKIEPSFLDLSPISLQTYDVWPHIVMKAYAKYLGNYEILQEGNVEEALRDFTGAPIERVHSENIYLSQILTQSLDRKYIAIAQPYPNLDLEFIEQIGLTVNNSYPITNVLLLYGESVFEIKDCLGKCTWNDPTLFENYKDEDLRVLQIGMKQNVFYMRQSDFQKVFGYVSICKVNEQFYYNAVPIRHAKNKYSARKLTLKQQSLCYFELTQVDKRVTRQSNYDYIQGRIIVLKKTDRDNFEYVDGVWDRRRNITVELNLSEGEYYIVCMLEYDRNIVDSVLSYYGEQPVSMQKVNFNKEQNILEKAIQQLCYEHGQRKDLNQDIQLYQLLQDKTGLIAYFYENINSYDEQNALIDLDLDEEKLVPLKAPSTNDLHLKPLSSDIFIWKVRQPEVM